MYKRRLTRIAVFFICLSLVFVTGCRRDRKEDYEKVEKTGYFMGTVITLKMYTHDAEKGERVAEKAFERIKEIETLMSANIQDSDVGRVNGEAGTRWVKVHEDTLEVIKRGIYYGELSGGLFDITVGPLVKLWGIGTENPRVPSSGELEDAVKLIDYRDIGIKEEDGQVMLKNPGMMIDLGGIAKGYAADEVKNVMLSEGIDHAIINLGGNVLTVGGKYDGGYWKIGVQDPDAPTGSPMGTVKVKDRAVVTSGDYERYFEKDGKRYHHILNPATGYPENNGLKGVTIVTPVSFDADALSTTVFLMGLDKGMELVENLEDVEAVFITGDKRVFVSSGLKESFEILDKTYSME